MNGGQNGPQEWRQQITELEDENRRAFLARDLDRLRELWSDALLVNSPVNRVHGKEHVLELLKAGIIAHVSVEADLEVVERQNDLVAVMGNERVVNIPGEAVIHRRFTNVWRREGGTWRMVLRHANITSA